MIVYFVYYNSKTIALKYCSILYASSLAFYLMHVCDPDTIIYVK